VHEVAHVHEVPLRTALVESPSLGVRGDDLRIGSTALAEQAHKRVTGKIVGQNEGHDRQTDDRRNRQKKATHDVLQQTQVINSLPACKGAAA
jgi:hypothetical protein